MIGKAFRRAFRLEFRLLVSRPATIIVLALLTLALLGSAMAGRHRIDRERLQAAQSAQEERRIEQDAKAAYRRYSVPSTLSADIYRDPTDSFGYMTQFLVRTAEKPVSPLGAVAVGQSDVQPSRIRMTFGFSAILGDDGTEIGDPHALRLGSFDPAFVLVYLLPLAIIAIAGTRLSSEQDAGILRLIAAQPVSPGRMIALKFGTVLALLSAWLLAAGAAACAIIGTTGLPGTYASVLAADIAAIWLYMALWVALCALAAVLWRGAAFAVTALILCWASFTVLLPGVGTLILDMAAPPPSRIDYVDASRQATSRFYAEGDAMADAWAKHIPILQGHPGLGHSTAAKRMARDTYYRGVLDPYRANFRQHDIRAARLAQWLRLLSPAMVLEGSLETAAGTDRASHGRYMIAVDGFDREIRRFFMPRILEQVVRPARVCAGCAGRLNFRDYDAVPRFRMAASPDSAQRAGWLAVFYLGAAVLLTLGAIALRCRNWP